MRSALLSHGGEKNRSPKLELEILLNTGGDLKDGGGVLQRAPRAYVLDRRIEDEADTEIEANELSNTSYPRSTLC